MTRKARSVLSFIMMVCFLFSNAAIAMAGCPCSQQVQPCQTCPPACQQPCPLPCPTTCDPYYNQEQPSKIEHLPTYKGSSVNMVKITSNSATVLANNVLKVTFTGDFNSKKVCPNNKISFVLNQGLTTTEGRKLLPCGTQVIGRIQQIEKPKWMNRNAKVYIVFEEMVLPNCVRLPMCAKVYAKDSALKASSWKAVGKAAGYTVGLFGVGAGLGAAIGTAGKASIGCMTYGMPIGAGVGLLAGTITPGLNYKAKEGKAIYIQLVQDLVICCNRP